MKGTLTKWPGLMLASLLVVACFRLDDNSAEWPAAKELEELQAQEARAVKRQAAAQALCNAERGPNSEARWTEDGDLVCTTRRGVRSVSP